MRAKKIILKCFFALILTSTIIIFGYNKIRTSKAEIIETTRTFTLNSITQFNFKSSEINWNYDVYIGNIDDEPYIFKPIWNDYIDDNSFFYYFALRLYRYQVSANNYNYGVYLVSYNERTSTFTNQIAIGYLDESGYYNADLYSTLDDDPSTWDLVISILYNRGFQIVRGLPLSSDYDFRPSPSFEDNKNPQTQMAFRGDFFNIYENVDNAYERGYNNGYDDGYNNGEYYGEQEGYVNGYWVGEEEGYNRGYSNGLIDGNTQLTEYSSVLRSAWNGATSILNTEVLGNLKVIHLIALPLILGLFLIILKLIRG